MNILWPAWKHGGFLVAERHGNKILTSTECTTVMTAVLMVTSGLESSLD
jgi:alkanesulfonate monooxygenase SsuD/methylene tetrahydromethanopterin reductase-like flavin-dependent oxidoreductase (luciferase family)